MNKAIAVILCSGAVAMTECAVIAAPRSDAEISKIFVGSWSVPPKSPDYERNKYSVETYGADGSDVAIWYTDATCKKVADRRTGKWTIKDGWLISKVSIGITFHDKIASISADEVTFFDDQGTHAMRRGTFCGAPVS
jgi:hypothetical protein